MDDVTPSGDESSEDDSFARLLRRAAHVSDAGGPALVPYTPGDVLCSGRFEILRRIGAGGMGVVFEASDNELGESVALKVLQKTNARAMRDTRAEFLALHDLSHRNLIHLGELHEHDGRWLYSMELIHGRDFISAVRPEGRLDEGALRSALAQLADALGELHGAGMLHRDIKPSNVLVEPGGRLVLLDLGLVGSVGMSSDGPAGTAAYMAPEQSAATPLDASVDLYAVGIMIVEALTGNLPFPPGDLGEDCKLQGLSPAIIDGVEPPDLAHLALELLAPIAEQRPAPATAIARLGGAKTRTIAPLCHGFVGRNIEINTLLLALEQSRTECVIARLFGDAGVGKSELLRQLQLRMEARGAVVLVSRCYERISVPFKAAEGVALQLEQYLVSLPKSELATLIDTETHLIGSILPVLRDISGEIEQAAETPVPTDPQETHARAFAALRSLLSRISANRPLALIVDDVQWADRDGMQLIDYLTRGAEAPCMLMLLSERRNRDAADTDEATEGTYSESRQDAADINIDIDIDIDIELGALPFADAAALAERLIVDEHTSAAAIARASNGHPLYIAELARAAGLGISAAESPDVSKAIAHRVQCISPNAREFLDLLCVAASPLPQALVGRAIALEPTTTASVIAGLRANHLLQSAGPLPKDDVEPYHSMVRDAVVASLTDERRRHCHRLLANAIESSTLAPGRPDLLMHHLAGCEDTDRAADFAERAADMARETLAFDRAADLYGRCLGFTDHAPERMAAINTRRGEALANAGRGAAAADAFELAAQTAPDGRIELRRRAAEQLLRSGHTDRGLAVLDNILPEVGVPKVLASRWRNRWPLAAVLVERLKLRAWRNEPRRVYASEVRREEAREELGARQKLRMECCWTAVIGLSMTSPLRSAEYQARHLRMALDANDSLPIGRGLALEAITGAAAGPPALRAHAILAEALPHCEKSAITRGYANTSRATIAFLCGEWRVALEHANRAESIFRQECIGRHWEIGTALRVSLTCLWHMGRIRELSRRTLSAIDDAKRRGDLYSLTQLRTVLLPNIHLMHDDIAQARQVLERAAADLPTSGVHLQHWQYMQASALVELYSGNASAAVVAVDARMPAIRRAFMFHVLAVRVFSYFVLGTALVGAAAMHPEDRALLRRADSVRRALGNEIGGAAAAEFLAAQAALIRGDRAEAHDRFSAASAGYRVKDFGLLDAACRWRLGELEGGASGHSQRDAIADAMRVEGIRCPERVIAMLAPVSVV